MYVNMYLSTAGIILWRMFCEAGITVYDLDHLVYNLDNADPFLLIMET